MAVEIRVLDRAELVRVRAIDRSERIDELYVQEGTRLERRQGEWSAPPWDLEGDGEHSVAAQVRALGELVDRGALALGAFHGDELVGIGVVLPELRPGVAQLAYLHVTSTRRAGGVGGRLADELERLACADGAASIVVSATPSVNTVEFYRRRGYEPMAHPLPELFELEPEDVHLAKSLGTRQPRG